MTLRLAPWVLVFFPAVALANGGPVASNEPGPLGGVQPIAERNVRLVSEDLTLTIAESGQSYRAEARYVLANPGGPRKVAFGVPVDLAGSADEWTGPTQELLANVAKDLRIEVGGMSVPCRVFPGSKPPRASSQPVQLAAAKKAAEDDEAPPDSSGWCVADLTLPAGDAIPLTLAYTADFVFVDMETSKTMLRYYEKRQLRYQLYPAGYWAGPPERVRIRVETGRFQGLATATPAPTRQEGSALVWDLERPDLKRLRELAVTLDAEPVLRHAELVGIRNLSPTDAHEVLRGSASSTLVAQGKSTYGASQLADFRGETAWCEGAAGDGVGEWVEVTRTLLGADGKEQPALELCRLEGFAIIPGYAKGQPAYDGNNRLRAFRLAPCGKPQAGQVFRLSPGADPRSSENHADLRLSGRYDRSALLVPYEEEDAARCVRLTILEVARGKAQDTCISELRPVFNCG